VFILFSVQTNYIKWICWDVLLKQDGYFIKKKEKVNKLRFDERLKDLFSYDNKTVANTVCCFYTAKNDDNNAEICFI